MGCRINKDSDKDGIFDDVDSCPNDPETWNKYLDKDGCPDVLPDQARVIHDMDQDGVIDVADLCPLEPGLVSNNGCPE